MPVRSRQGSCTTLSLISAVLVLTVPAGNPLRPLAGLLLAGPLLAWSIDRLVVGRSRERPSAEVRWSLAVGFTLVTVVGLGLLLAVTPVELRVTPMVIGVLLVIAACDLSAAVVQRGPTVLHSSRPGVLGLACAAVGLSVAAFLIARDSAVSASRTQSTPYAYLVGSGTRYQVMLANPTAAAQRFAVTIDRLGVRPVHVRSAVGPRTQVRLPVAIISRRGSQPAFTVTAAVITGPQPGVTLHLTAPAAG